MEDGIQYCDKELTAPPLFSIIVPLWNRQDMIEQCISSCLSQTFSDFEIIVVDDASTDESLVVVEKYDDPRVKLVKLLENVGPAAARHAGVKVARGAWFVYLDSDWHLKANALESFTRIIREVSKSVGVVGLMCELDTGQKTPNTPPPPGTFGFREWLKWSEDMAVSDYLMCHRRDIYRDLNWPTDRRLEMQFVIQVASQWETIIDNTIGAIIYTSANNRITSDVTPGANRNFLRRAKDMSEMLFEILQEFGSPMKKYSPKRYQRILRMCVYFSYLAKKRIRGIKMAFRYLCIKPFSCKMWVTIFLGSISPQILVWIKKMADRILK